MNSEAHVYDPSLSRNDIVNYGALIEQYDLDAADLSSHALMLATLGSDGNKISGSNINAMVLGSRVFSDQSTFVSASIFDIAKLNSDAIIIDTANQSYTRFTLDLSSDVNKTATIGAWNGSISASVKTLFYEAGVAYNQSTYNQDTSLSQKGAGTMNQYNYGFLKFDTQINKADWSIYLSGIPLDFKDGTYPDESKYISLVDVKDEATGDVYKKIQNLQPYDDAKAGKYFGSPLANYQMLLRYEFWFNQLRDQLLTFSSKKNDAVSTSTYADLNRLRVNINQSVKSFMAVWGDSFVTTLGGSHALRATAIFDNQGATHSYESNYAGSVSLKYSGLVAGADLKGQLGRYTKDAGGNTKGTFSVIGTEIPTTDFNAAQQFATNLQKSLNDFVAGTTTSVVIPDKVIGNVSFPALPDPVAPLKPTDFPSPTKTLEELNAAKELVKQGWDPDKLPPYLKDYLGKTGQDIHDPALPVAAAPMDVKSQSLSSQGVSTGLVQPAASQAGAALAQSNSQEKANIAAARAKNKAATLLLQSLAQRRVSLTQAALLDSSKSPRRYGLTPRDDLNASLILKQQKKLRLQRGLHLKALEKRRTQKLLAPRKADSAAIPKAFIQAAALATPTTSCQVNNQIKPCSLAITHFETLPYVDRLPGLRPDLRIPTWTNAAGNTVNNDRLDSTNGAPNVAVLLSYINRYQTVANYLNLISTSPYSNITAANVSRLNGWLDAFITKVMTEVNFALNSGTDVTECKVWEVITQNIEMPSYTGDCASSTLVITADENPLSANTTLSNALGNVDLYAYVKMLAEDPFRFRVIAMGQGGYLPFINDAQGHLQKITLIQTGRRTPPSSEDLRPVFASTSLLSNQRPGDLLSSMPSDLAAQSAWFPIYGFVPNGGAPLLRFQIFSQDKMILIGRKYTVLPDAAPNSFEKPEQRTPINQIAARPMTGFSENSTKPSFDVSTPEGKTESDRWDAGQKWWHDANQALGLDPYGLNTQSGRSCSSNGKDGCTPYDNGFFDNDMDWYGALWFKESPNVSSQNRYQNQLLTLYLTADPETQARAVFTKGPGVDSYGLAQTRDLLIGTFINDPNFVGTLTTQSVMSPTPYPVTGQAGAFFAIALVPVNANTVTYERPDITDPNAAVYATPIKSQAISPGSLMSDIMQRDTAPGGDGGSPLDTFYLKQIYHGNSSY